MKNTWTTWLLAGALLASLQWNLRGWLGNTGPETAGPAPAVASCDVDLDALGLSPDQERELEELCRLQCALPVNFEARADEKLHELRDALSETELDEARLRSLVREVCELREQSLTACVDAVLEVRTILDGEQLEEVMTSCAVACGAGGHSCAKADSTE